MIRRRTIAQPRSLDGHGLHSGERVTLTVVPAPPHSGLRFRRADVGGVVIPADSEYSVEAERRSVLVKDGIEVMTIEHLLAAVAGLGIDDLIVELDAGEVPIMDGSALPFVEALRAAGIVEHDGAPAVLAVSEPFAIDADGATYQVSPAAELTLDIAIDWAHPCIGRQTGSWTLGPQTFTAEIAAARTFGFLSDRQALLDAGLARGSSAANTVLLTDTDVVNGPLRWPDEFVRHKALDLLGDLTLVGARLAAHISADRPGHRSNRALVEALRVRSPVSSYGD